MNYTGGATDYLLLMVLSRKSYLGNTMSMFAFLGEIRIMSKNNKDKQNNQLSDMVEWQDKQYTPWHYYQKGKTVPGVAGEGNLKLFAIVQTIVGGLGIAGLAIAIISGFMYSNHELAYACMPVIGISIWQIIIHWKRYKRQKEYFAMKRDKQKYGNRKKKHK